MWTIVHRGCGAPRAKKSSKALAELDAEFVAKPFRPEELVEAIDKVSA